MLVRLPGLLFILVMRHPVERHVSEFNYAGAGYNNVSACGDVAAYREWARTESPSGAFNRGLYISNYFVRALTGLCRGVIRCPANEPGCQSGAQVPLDCSTAHPTWLEQLHGQAPWPDEHESEPSRQSARSGWRQALARQVLDSFDVILTSRTPWTAQLEYSGTRSDALPPWMGRRLTPKIFPPIRGSQPVR